MRADAGPMFGPPVNVGSDGGGTGKMAGFWSPYADMHEAATRIGRFADKAFGPGCGIFFSDGRSVALLRRAHLDAHGAGRYLNVLCTHISAPHPPPAGPAAASGFRARAERFFGEFLQASGEAELTNARLQHEAAEAAIKAVHDKVWEPAHNYLLAHKKFADGVGVAADVLGVFAGAVFVVALGPEVVGALGLAAVATGISAALGSTLLLVADGRVFIPEIMGDEETSRRVENQPFTQWARIIGTAMTLVDIPVGGPRALVEVGRRGGEARVALSAARKSDTMAEAARARAAGVVHPRKHPTEVQRWRHRANVLARQAEHHRTEAESLANRMRWVAGRDVGASFVATPTGTALLVGSPPSMVLSAKQKEADEAFKLLEPEHGMPADIRLEMRTSSAGKPPRGEP